MSPVDTRLTCAACHHEGYDVSSRIVEIPEAEQIPVQVGDFTVPERFRREPRCMDRETCEDRIGEPRHETR